MNADYGVEAELSKYVSVTDTFNFWDFRIPSNSAWNQLLLTGVATTKGPPVVFGTSMLTPLTDPSLTPTTTTPNSNPPNVFRDFLGQKNTGNTLMGIVHGDAEVKLSGGWRFNERTIALTDDPTLTWHQNWLLLGGVVQPSHAFRLNVNYDVMHSKSSNPNTPEQYIYARGTGSDQSPAAARDGQSRQVDQLRRDGQRLLRQER